MISFSACSVASFHMRFLMDTYKGERTSWGKLSVAACLIWFLFFNQRFPFSHMLPLFQENFIFVKATSSHFFRVTTSRQVLFSLFQNSHFFAGVIFSEQLLFRSENSTEQPLLENRRFFTAVTLRNSFFFGGTVKDKGI